MSNFNQLLDTIQQLLKNMVFENDPQLAPIQELLKDMVLVEEKDKGGTFTMGSPLTENIWHNETQHQVALSTFCIGKYPVTQAQWKAVMNNNNPSPSHFKGDNLPVDSVSWNDAQAFIRQLNELLKVARKSASFRLPTEAEWEYAARGGKCSEGYKEYAGSNNIDEVAWYNGNSGTHPVGEKEKYAKELGLYHMGGNELGLYDMSGNIFEWCNDWYAADYYNNSPTNNPTGPTSGTSCVLRGGSYHSFEQHCRVAYRFEALPTCRYINFGFRLVFVP